MSDQEMLELAAWAYGSKGWRENPHYMKGFLSRWNPLIDDGDAFRLAVKLDFAVCLEVRKNNVRIDGASPSCLELVNETLGDDPYAATRRAIVRAAAEIGKAMKEAALRQEESP